MPECKIISNPHLFFSASLQFPATPLRRPPNETARIHPLYIHTHRILQKSIVFHHLNGSSGLQPNAGAAFAYTKFLPSASSPSPFFHETFWETPILYHDAATGGLNKTAPAAVLHGPMFSKPCASAQGRVQCTRAAAQAAALRLLYHIFKLTLRVPLVFTNRTYYTIFPFPRPTVEKRGTGRAPCTEHRTRPPAARKRGAPVKCAAKAVSPSPRRQSSP